jgi:hypothetical protein
MKNTTSQKPPSEVENTINAIASSINNGETIILCGSGISQDSGLPVVNELIPYILITLCSDHEEISSLQINLETIVSAKERNEKALEREGKIAGLDYEVFFMKDDSQAH